ncbi:MAG: DUF4202 family protein [Patescibacteria group bacterium]
MFDKVERFVIDAFTEAGALSNISHHQRTVYWIKKLKPDADEALLIAGIAHDIERAFYGDWKKGSDDPALLRKHQDLSAVDIEKFLRHEGAEEELIARVKHFVANHETGGDEDQNVLCDADCLAFLEEKAVSLAKKSMRDGSTSEAGRRIRMVFHRISSPFAKQIAQPWYEEAKKYLTEMSTFS